MAIFANPVVKRAVITLSLSAAGVVGIIKHEAKVNTVYLDPVRIPTVCVGHVTTLPVGAWVSDKTCNELLVQDTTKAQTAVKRGVKVPLSQQQYDQLVSFTFNVGGQAFLNSTMLVKLNSGDCHGAAKEILRWDRAKGKQIRGLTIRRQYESTKFEEHC